MIRLLLLAAAYCTIGFSTVGFSAESFSFAGTDQPGPNKSAQHKHSGGHAKHGAKHSKPCDKLAISCAKKVSSVVDNNGRIWSVWALKQHLYLNYSDDLGRHYSEPMKVNPIGEKISTRGENRPKIATDNQGNVYLSWVTPLSKRFTANVRFSYWSVKQQRFSEPVTVNDDGLLTGHSFNELVVSGQGDVYISWLDGRAKIAAEKKGIRLRTSELYLASANFITGDTQFTNSYLAQGTCVCCRLAMDIDDNNLPMVMWRHVFGDNYRDHGFITMQNKTQANEMQRVSFENWQVDGCPHQGPTIVKSNFVKENVKTSRIHMSWFNNAPDASGLFYSYSDDNGRTMAKVNHFANKAGNPEHPFLSQNNQGGIELVWREFDGQQYRIQYISSIDGNEWSEEKTIAISAATVDYPYILNHPRGSYLHWHKAGQPLQLVKLP